jgi:flavin reductase (DIM6/NTAB) family NADH-FMN oxidoreductase RutF
MRQLKLSKAFTLMESGPVVLVTTRDGRKANIMTISWTMVLDFTPMFAITTGEWNHSFAALRKNRECVIAIPTVDMRRSPHPSTPPARKGARFTPWATARSSSTGAGSTAAG